MSIRAKKSLGQNFLKSKEALRALIEAGDVQPTDTILEVGPGKGVLTEELLKRAQKVIAVEKDNRLTELLSEKFKKEIADKKLTLLNQDILEWEPASPQPLSFTGEGGYKIIANIPYYITGTFLQKFLETTNQPEKMVVMVQKEVAQRIVAKDGKESILSMSVKAYGNPKYIMTVKAKYFSPAPNVDSAIILIDDISKKFFGELASSADPSLTRSESLNTQGQHSAHAKSAKGYFPEQIGEKKFFEIMKLGFAHKRKMLIGNLSEKYPREKILEAFQKNGINEKVRAEDITLTDWKNLISEL